MAAPRWFEDSACRRAIRKECAAARGAAPVEISSVESADKGSTRVTFTRFNGRYAPETESSELGRQ